MIEIDDERTYLEDAFNIALQTKITVYDALYMAQAIK